VIHDHQDYTAGLHFLPGLGHLPPVRIAHVHNPILHISQYASTPLRRLTVTSGKRLLAKLATDIAGTSRQIVSEYGFDDGRFNHLSGNVVHCGFDVTSLRCWSPTKPIELRKEFGGDESSRILLLLGGGFGGKSGFGSLPPMVTKNPDFAMEIARACMGKQSKSRCLAGAANEQVNSRYSSSVGGLKSRLDSLGSALTSQN
jgi:hypothetical protein